MTRLLGVMLLVLGCGCSQRPTPAMRDRGDFLYDHGHYAAAADQYAEITNRYPGDWEAHYKLGLCRLELGQLADARRELEIAHTSSPRNGDVIDALAETMFRQGESEGLFDFVKQRAGSQQTVRAWLRMARYAAELGDADTDSTAFETAIVIDDGASVEPYLQASAFAESLGDMDEALRRLRQAYGIDPHDPMVNERLRALGEIPGPTIILPPGT